MARVIDLARPALPPLATVGRPTPEGISRNALWGCWIYGINGYSAAAGLWDIDAASTTAFLKGELNHLPAYERTVPIDRQSKSEVLGYAKPTVLGELIAAGGPLGTGRLKIFCPSDNTTHTVDRFRIGQDVPAQAGLPVPYVRLFVDGLAGGDSWPAGPVLVYTTDPSGTPAANWSARPSVSISIPAGQTSGVSPIPLGTTGRPTSIAVARSERGTNGGPASTVNVYYSDLNDGGWGSGNGYTVPSPNPYRGSGLPVGTASVDPYYVLSVDAAAVSDPGYPIGAGVLYARLTSGSVPAGALTVTLTW